MINLSQINAGAFRLDGGAIFGTTPKVFWSKWYQPDSSNRIAQALRPLLIIDKQRKILVDTGIGNWHGDKFIDIYGLDTPEFTFDEVLASQGLSADDITDVILTHLHFDHAGGFVTKKGTDIIPAFPNAELWLGADHLSWAQNPSPKDKASFKNEYLSVISKWPRINLLKGQTRITPDISVIPVDGHTPGMLTVLVEAGNNKYFFCSDLVPTAAHLHIPCNMAYDNAPVKTASEKADLLSRASREQWTICFYHDPVYCCSKVISKQGKFTIDDSTSSKSLLKTG